MITGSAAAATVPAASITYGWSTGKTAEWWSAWGQWMGAAGSIVAAVAALWIAWWGWERAEKLRAADAEAARRAQVRRDLDETRRIALTAHSIRGPQGYSPEVIATVVNALAYHSEIVTPNVAHEVLTQFQSGGDQQRVIEQLIDMLCRELGDPPLFGTAPTGS